MSILTELRAAYDACTRNEHTQPVGAPFVDDSHVTHINVNGEWVWLDEREDIKTLTRAAKAFGIEP